LEKDMRIALALQGGGAHGAYTWGVLDRLLREPDIDVDAVSGASAGAVNGVALLEGWRLGGARGARAMLERIWNAVGGRSQLTELLGIPAGFRNHAMHHAALKGVAQLTRWMSAEQLNPLGLDPLGEILDDSIDFKRFSAAPGAKFFVSATDIEARCARVFSRSEITRDVILASACLPHLQRGVSIQGRIYWDGGLTSNPPLWPLVRYASARHIVLIRLGAKRDNDDLSTPESIRGEMTELSFEAPLAAELESIATAQAMARASWMTLGDPMRRLRQIEISSIGSPDWLGQFDPISKVDTAPVFLEELRHAGENAAIAWLRRR
jgi:NTE family protein